VHAFEPQRLVFQALCGNLALNSCTNVFAHQAALGEAFGEILVPAILPQQPNNFGGISLVTASSGEPVIVRTVDGLGLVTCHLLKVDVEGMEIEVLRGAAATVRAHRPTLYLENDRSERSAALIGLLLSWNYRVYWHLPPLYQPDNFAGDAEDIFPGIVSINVLGLPAERGIAVQGGAEVTGPDDDWRRLVKG
jgi:FkbM family methyltransferase